MSQVANDVPAPQPAKSRPSRIALAASVAGAVLAVPVAWSLFRSVPGDLRAPVALVWFALSVIGFGLGVVQLLRPRQHRRQPGLAVALSVMSMLVFVLAAGAFSFLAEGSLRSDDEMLATFRQNESQFARAVADYRLEGRLDRALLERLGVEADTVWTDGSGAVYLNVSTQGLAVSGSSKGYAYSKRPLSPTVDSLDHYRSDAPGGFVFRHIKGPWYLYYYWTV